jgi:DNA-binding LacI/PurR family transcriptional regulator
MSKGPTIRDVAKQASVSLGTASNVLNNKGHVSAEVRNRVWFAVNTLGYKHPVVVATDTVGNSKRSAEGFVKFSMGQQSSVVTE